LNQQSPYAKKNEKNQVIPQVPILLERLLKQNGVDVGCLFGISIISVKKRDWRGTAKERGGVIFVFLRFNIALYFHLRKENTCCFSFNFEKSCTVLKEYRLTEENHKFQ